MSAPLRGRFGLVLRLNHYDVAELKTDCEALGAAAERPDRRGGRRGDLHAAAAARRVSPTGCCGACAITRKCAPTGTSRAMWRETALDLLEVDRFGLDEIDQKIMRTVLEKFGGGPVGVNTIAASIGEEPDTIEEVYEPYLIQLGFLHRSPRGRMATDSAFDYFKVPRRLRTGEQPALF